MITLSVCLIIKDEERVLDRCLSAVCRFADELIILDTGSVDRSRDIALRYTEFVYDFTWKDDFSEARNASFSYGTGDYLMWIDADDVISEESVEALLRLKQTIDPKTDVIFCIYRDDLAKLYGTQVMRDRIWRRELGIQWTGAVNEGIKVRDAYISYIAADIVIVHDKVHVNNPDRNLNIYEGLRKNGEPLQGFDIYYYARDLYAHNRVEEALEFLRPHIYDESNSYLPMIILQFVQCLFKLEREDEAFAILLHTLSYERPRAYVCCWIGNALMTHGRYDAAIFWYEAALKLPKQPLDCLIDVTHCHELIPYQQLVKCHYKLGNLEEASRYNELSALIRPESQAVISNRALFHMLRDKI